jgi:succinoglycan biosynthesis protein ExoH
MRLPKEVSDRISMLRPLLIIGVVFVHIAGISDKPSEITPGLFNWFAAFFKNGFFRGTVPTMSLISGFLLFNAGLDQSPKTLFKKKLATLAIPYIIFNAYCLLFMAGMNAAFGPVFPSLMSLQQSSAHLVGAFFGLTDYPLNSPLHFVRDMMVAIMLVPVLGIFLRHAPLPGLGALAVIFGLDLDGPLIFRASSLLLFYIGGAAAVHRWNLLALDKYAKACLAAFIVVCVVTVGGRIDDNTCLVAVSPFLIWPAASLLRKTRLEAWAIGFCKYSFFIFAAHMPIIGTAWWAVTHHARSIPYPVYWFAAPVLCILLLKLVYDAALKIAPDAFNYIIGARATTPAFVDRRRAARPFNAPVYSPEVRLALQQS